jgi:oligopeptide/dipeptide ABC transporter ATP-binding protein
LIADEPTRNLDVTIQAGILKLIGELQKELKISILFIANNIGLINIFCKTAGVLYRGKLIEEGPSYLVVRSPLHPYTQALISAIPRDKSEQLKFSNIHIKPDTEIGCPYTSRCSLAKEKCATTMPMLESYPDGRKVACFFLDRSTS